MVVTLALESPEARAAAEAARSAEGRVVLVPRITSPPEPGGPRSERYARVGTVAKLDVAGELPGGTRAVVVRGEQRAVIGAGVASSGQALWVSVERAEETPGSPRAAEQARELRLVVENILDRRGASRWREVLAGVTEPGAVADSAGYWPDLSMERKVELLETLDVDTRVERVLGWAREILAELELKERIRTDVAEVMERTQREFLLRQQLAAIRKELGESDESGSSDDYRARLEALVMPELTRATIAKEIDRLERTSEQSPEQGWIRTWLDTALDLPWGERTEDRIEVHEARAVLDADHSGLRDVKDRIIEYLAVRKLGPNEMPAKPTTGRKRRRRCARETG
jgi:ATP-dependent Lon protease